jgi:hypothetical protein
MLATWMETLIGAEQSGAYPPYCESLVMLDLPEDDIQLVFGQEAA